MTDQFYTLAGNTKGYYMSLGSKFFAYAAPVMNEVEFGHFLSSVKKEHPKATHHCTAIRLHTEGDLERASDDGEPSGSAGRPILGQLISRQLTYTGIVVARYFGGTKLGIPGLIEAYRESAAAALSAGTIITRQVYTMAGLTLSYERYPAFSNLLRQENIWIADEVFRDRICITIGLPASRAKNELMRLLKAYSHLDFEQPGGYADYLGIEIDWMEEVRYL